MNDKDRLIDPPFCGLLAFDFEAESASNLSVPALLGWIAALHGELADSGAWERLSTDTHSQMMILAKEADHVVGFTTDPEAWTHADQQAALSYGWGLFETPERGLHVERFDDARIFDGDDAARHWVEQRALHVDGLERKAIARVLADASRRGGIEEAAQSAAIWQLADDALAYGDRAGWFILVSPNGEHELSRELFETEGEARGFAQSKGWRIVPLDVDEQENAAETAKDLVGTGRLAWIADDEADLAEVIGKTGVRLVSTERNPNGQIAYVIEVDKAHAHEALGYWPEAEEWLEPEEDSRPRTGDPNAAQALERAIQALETFTSRESRGAARTLKAILDQRGCAHLEASEPDRLTDLIDIIVFG